MTRIIIESTSGQELEVERGTFDAGYFPGYWYVRDAGGSSSPGVPAYIDADMAAAVTSGTSQTSAALRAAFGLSVVATVSADAALALGKFTPVDATAAARTMTLPTGAGDGVAIGVEKVDVTANAVSVTGNIRGVAATTITLPWQHETLLLRADSTGSWWPVAGHKTKASLDANYLQPVGRVLYVSATGSDSAATGRGTTPALAYATIQAAVNALSGGGGGTVIVGPGTFAPFVIDAATADFRGVKVIGSGVQTTIVASTSAGVDGVKITSDGGSNATMIGLENFAITGTATSGWGLNLGGGNWNQMGRIICRDLRIDGNGAGGVLAYDINDCLFSNVGTDSNYGPAWRITGRSTDGTGTVFRGNTNVWMDCRTQGRTDHSTNGWEFLNCGNSWSIIGGETSFFAEAVKVTNAGGENSLGFLGVHFENNTRSVHIGDQAVTGGDAKATFRSCFFLAASGTPADHVLLDGAVGTLFSECTFAGTTTATIVEAAGRSNFYTVEGCVPQSGVPLITKADATTIATVNGSLRRNGRHRVDTNSINAADSFGGLYYAKNTGSTGEPMYGMENANGVVGIYMSQGTPEGSVTAPVGSVCLRRNGGANTSFYVKETGTGNTGWVPYGAGGTGPTGPQGVAGGLSALWRTAQTIWPAGGTTTLTNALAFIRAFPVTVPTNGGTPWTINTLGVDVSTAASGGTAACRFGIYRNDSAGNLWYPGSLLYDSGATTADCTVTGIRTITGQTISIPDTLGTIWLAAVIQGTATTAPQMRYLANTPWAVPDRVGTGANTVPTGYQITTSTITGALPDPYPNPGATTVGNMPRIHFALS